MNPNTAVVDSAFEFWQQQPGNFSKHDCRPARFTMAALAGQELVEITHVHLDRQDRPTLVFLLHGEEPAAVFLSVNDAGTNLMIKGTSLGALAAGIELLDSCFSVTSQQV